MPKLAMHNVDLTVVVHAIQHALLRVEYHVVVVITGAMDVQDLAHLYVCHVLVNV